MNEAHLDFNGQRIRYLEYGTSRRKFPGVMFYSQMQYEQIDFKGSPGFLRGNDVNCEWKLL